MRAATRLAGVWRARRSTKKYRNSSGGAGRPARGLLLLLASLALGSGACASFERIGLHDACEARPFGPPTQAGQLSLDERSSHQHTTHQHAGLLEDSADVRGAADWLLVVYQRHLRRTELPGQGCPFYPSCSAFARDAFHHHVAPVGLMLTVDRLFIREHFFIAQQYPEICTKNGATRLYDPVPWAQTTAHRRAPARITRVAPAAGVCLDGHRSPNAGAGASIGLRPRARR